MTRLIDRNTTPNEERPANRSSPRTVWTPWTVRRTTATSSSTTAETQWQRVGGSVRQGWDFASTEQHHEPRVHICLAVEQGFHLPGCHHVRMLCRLPVSRGRGLLKCGIFVGAGRHSHLSRASETAGGVPIKRNRIIPERVLHVINMSENSSDILRFFLLMCGSAVLSSRRGSFTLKGRRTASGPVLTSLPRGMTGMR